MRTDAQSPLVVTGENVWLQSFFQTAELGAYRVQLHGYSRETGRDTIRCDLGLVQHHSPPSPTIAADDSALYLALGSTEVRAIRAATGKVLWDTVGFESIGDLTITDEFVIFIARSKARETSLVALDTRDGRIAWSQQLE